MKLAFEIPLKHWDDFAPLADFHYALAHLWENPEYRKNFEEAFLRGEEIWLDNSINELGYPIPTEKMLEIGPQLNPSAMVANESKDPIENLKCIVESIIEYRKQGFSGQIIGTWRGGKKELMFLENICDIVALPYDLLRNSPLTKETSKKYHYFGFRNLDELRLFPPRSLDTSVPIRLGYMGVDIRTLDRRPKVLPPFSLDMVLSPGQVKLAILNIQAIREAASYGEQDNS